MEAAGEWLRVLEEAPAGLVPGWEGMPKPASPGAWSACGVRGAMALLGPVRRRAVVCV